MRGPWLLCRLHAPCDLLSPLAAIIYSNNLRQSAEVIEVLSSARKAEEHVRGACTKVYETHTKFSNSYRYLSIRIPDMLVDQFTVIIRAYGVTYLGY